MNVYLFIHFMTYLMSRCVSVWQASPIPLPALLKPNSRQSTEAKKNRQVPKNKQAIVGTHP